MDNTNITAIITGIFGLITTGIATWQAIKIKRLDKEKALEIHRTQESNNERLKALSYVIDIQIFSELLISLRQIFDNTPTDRFLILYGINGRDVMLYVTAIFHYQDFKWKINALDAYKEIEIDNPYQEMLVDAERNGCVILDVDTMPDCILKRFYQAEGVKSSIIKFFLRKHLSDTKDMVLYCSFASHREDKLNKQDEQFIMSKFGTLKRIIAEILQT